MNQIVNSSYSERLAAKEKQFSDNAIKIERLRQENAVLSAEIRAFREAYEMLTGTQHSSAVMPNSQQKPRKRRERKLSDEWIAILGLAGEGFREFGYDDIVDAGLIHGEDIKKPSARAQIMKYVQNGIVERRGDGRFVLTDKGAEMALMAEPQMKTDASETPTSASNLFE